MLKTIGGMSVRVVGKIEQLWKQFDGKRDRKT